MEIKEVREIILLIFFIYVLILYICYARDWIQSLICNKQALYHWATPPTPDYSFIHTQPLSGKQY
jgi:hypothetical protein